MFELGGIAINFVHDTTVRRVSLNFFFINLITVLNISRANQLQVKGKSRGEISST